MRLNGTRRHNRGSELATYKAAELARILGIARNGVYAALRSGKIPHLRIGRRFVIPRAALNAWLASALQPAARVGSTEGKRLRDQQRTLAPK
jgi:excisionase family DNA binding protein